MEPNLDLLTGEIEIDEAWVGGLEKNKHSNKKQYENWVVGKQLVLGFRERYGRIIIGPIPSGNKQELLADILFAVEEGASIYTDEGTAYHDLGKWCEHESVNHSKGEYVREHVTTNSIESVWAIVKHAHEGVYHQWSKTYGHRYVNETAYRLTEGNIRIPVKARIRRLTLKCFEVQLTYKELVR